MLKPLIIREHVKDAASGVLLRTYLTKRLGMSRSLIKSIKYNGGAMLVNGERQNVRYRLYTGDEVIIHLPHEEPSPTLYRTPMALNKLYEDDHCLIINKQAGLPVIPSYKYPDNTLANGVLNYLKEQQHAYTVHTVTRLDKDTSGIVLIAKHRYAHERFSNLQSNGRLSRRYLAWVTGQLDKEEGVIDAPIGRKEGSIIERIVKDDGKRAVTNYNVIKQEKGCALVNVELETGRTHQIRVHFSSLGHPLLGDDLYGGEKHIIERQALHCYCIEFPHPFTGKLITIKEDPPDDFSSIATYVRDR